MGNNTTAKSLKCDVWCKLGIRLDAPWKGGWLDLVANDNGHRQESKFNSENEHYHLQANIFWIFLAQLHEQEEIISKLLKHVG
jgi:hypothetical protein